MYLCDICFVGLYSYSEYKVYTKIGPTYTSIWTNIICKSEGKFTITTKSFFADWIFMLNHFYHKKLEKIMCNYFQIWVLLRNYGLILGRFSMERDEEKKILKKMKSKYTKHWNILLNSIIKIMKKILKAFDLLPFWRKNLIKATIVLTLVTVKLKFICSILNGFWK